MPPFSDPNVYRNGTLFLDEQGRLYNLQRAVWRYEASVQTLWPGAERSGPVSISPNGRMFVVMVGPSTQGTRICSVEADGQLRTVAGSDGLNHQGVRLGALPGALNWVSALHAVNDKLLLVLCENSVLRIDL